MASLGNELLHHWPKAGLPTDQENQCIQVRWFDPSPRIASFLHLDDATRCIPYPTDDAACIECLLLVLSTVWNMTLGGIRRSVARSIRITRKDSRGVMNMIPLCLSLHPCRRAAVSRGNVAGSSDVFFSFVILMINEPTHTYAHTKERGRQYSSLLAISTSFCIEFYWEPSFKFHLLLPPSSSWIIYALLARTAYHFSI